MKQSVWVGFDPREVDGFAVTMHSIRSRWRHPVELHGIVLSEMREKALYKRPTHRDAFSGRLIDELSRRPDYDGAISTEFAISRFLIKALAKEGWAVFMDSDVLVLTDINELFAELDPSKAVMCVKHDHRPEATKKMDGQLQTQYARKNWSSVFALNCQHPSNLDLTVELINTVPGRDLHRFNWLEDDDIGELSADWNFLVGHNDPEMYPDPKIVHFTDGVPSMKGYEDVIWAEEWRDELADWAKGDER